MSHIYIDVGNTLFKSQLVSVAGQIGTINGDFWMSLPLQRTLTRYSPGVSGKYSTWIRPFPSSLHFKGASLGPSISNP